MSGSKSVEEGAHDGTPEGEDDKEGGKGIPAMTAQGDATNHERAVAMESRCLPTAKKAMAPTEMAMVSHLEGPAWSEWPRNSAIAARILGPTSSLHCGYLQLTGQSKLQIVAWGGALTTSMHHVSSGRKR